ncbi:MAG TPA: TIR domain-containing protein [Myxococcaceae bacterium]
MARIFISYKRIDPDTAVAQALHRTLSEAGHEVFLDLNMPAGVRWAERIEEELQRTEVLIALLSEQAVRSEMAVGEIETAVRLKKRILPVRLAYREPFQYPLSAWLNPINWAIWDGPDGTPQLAEALKRAASGGELPVEQGPGRGELLKAVPRDALTLESGAMDVESPLYVRRSADDVALAAIARKGQTLNIKGPRQVGKSSLLMRVIGAAAAAGKRVAYVDFQGSTRPAWPTSTLSIAGSALKSAGAWS